MDLPPKYRSTCLTSTTPHNTLTLGVFPILIHLHLYPSAVIHARSTVAALGYSCFTSRFKVSLLRNLHGERIRHPKTAPRRSHFEAQKCKRSRQSLLPDLPTPSPIRHELATRIPTKHHFRRSHMDPSWNRLRRCILLELWAAGWPISEIRQVFYPDRDDLAAQITRDYAVGSYMLKHNKGIQYPPNVRVAERWCWPGLIEELFGLSFGSVITRIGHFVALRAFLMHRRILDMEERGGQPAAGQSDEDLLNDRLDVIFTISEVADNLEARFFGKQRIVRRLD